jgi:cell division ATPase FtsA
VVQNQKLWYFSSLPIGASSINNDLREFLRIPAKDIDQLKRKYASALAANVPDNVTVPVKTASNTKKQILQRNIAEIVEERLKDIAGFVARELKAAKFSNKVPGGVVLTGGSAYLANIEELFARELGMEVRLGRMLNGLDDESQQQVSAFPQSVAIGLLLYGAQHNACETMPEMPHLVAAKAKNATNNQTPNIATSVSLDFTNVEPVATPECSVVVESVAEKAVTTEIEEQPQEVTPITENLEPQTEKVEQTAVEKQPEKQPEEQPEVTNPRRPKWQERFRSFAERFRNKVDDMFTDELI